MDDPWEIPDNNFESPTDGSKKAWGSQGDSVAPTFYDICRARLSLHGGLIGERTNVDSEARVADEHIEKDGINKTGGPGSDDEIEASLAAVCIESDDANTRNSSDANKTGRSGNASAPRRRTVCCPHPRLFEPHDSPTDGSKKAWGSQGDSVAPTLYDICRARLSLHGGLIGERTNVDEARVADEHIEKDGINKTGGPGSDDDIEASLAAVCIESDDANTRNSSDANKTGRSGNASAPRRRTVCCPHPRLFEPHDFDSKYTVVNPVIGNGPTSYVMEIAKKSPRRSSISLGERSHAEKSPLMRNEVATSTGNYACKVIKMRGFDQVLGKSSSSAAEKLKTFEQGAKLERVQMELRAIMMALESLPSIVLKLHDVVWSVSTRECFLVTELARGGTLATALEMRGELQESLPKEVMLQVLDGVAFMHQHGLAHRDLKLENILLLMEPDEFGMGSVKISRLVTPTGLSYLL